MSNKIYTYEDWWEGRIALGGSQTFEPGHNLEEIQNKVKFVGWKLIKEEDVIKIKEKQKEIFDEKVNFYFNKKIEKFNSLYASSKEKEIFIATVNADFLKLFSGYYSNAIDDVNWFCFSIFNFSGSEINTIQHYFLWQIIGGKKSHDYIQSPNQTLQYFKEPPTEVWAEITYIIYKKIGEELRQIRTNQEGQSELQKVPIPVIALMYQYLRFASLHSGINEKNCSDIAKEYNWHSRTSGKQLFDDYKKFMLEEERIRPFISDHSDPGFNKSKASRLKILNAAVLLLSPYPTALEIAKKELEKAQQL